MLVDPNGMEVEADEASQDNIRNTLTKQEAKYIKFNQDGVLDVKRLNKSKCISENMTALKALANSEVVYNFQVTDKDHNGRSYYENGDDYYRGTTEMPNAENNPSLDSKVYILVGNNLNKKQQALTTAHEAYGHAYFYENTRDTEKSIHTGSNSVSYTNNSYEIAFTLTNIALENQINTVVKQASINYDSRKRK